MGTNQGTQLNWVPRDSQFNIPPTLLFDGIPFWALLGLTVCGPTCLSMVTAGYHRLNQENPYIGPAEAIEACGLTLWGDPNHHVVLGYGVTPQTLVEMAQKNGYSAVQYRYQPPHQIQKILDLNIPVLCFVGAKDPTKHTVEWFRNGPLHFPYVSGEHIIVCTGYQTQGDATTFSVHDPLHVANWAYSIKELQSAMWIYYTFGEATIQLLSGNIVLIYPPDSEQAENIARLNLPRR